MKYYDKENKRLIMIESRADKPEFWENLWQAEDLKMTIIRRSRSREVLGVTKKFLEKGAKILEAGCGIGNHVYGLTHAGYDAWGVDFAADTIKKSQKAIPELKLFAQDVRNLKFNDGYFDGYWSLGLIEHFWFGYGDIIKEARRVLRPGGYLFITFPYMSPLRKLKAALRLYLPKERISEKERKNFYQFIFASEEVKREFKNAGFNFVTQKSFNGTKGLKDEARFLKPALQKIYDSKSKFGKGVNLVLSKIFALFAGHSILLVFRAPSVAGPRFVQSR